MTTLVQAAAGGSADVVQPTEGEPTALARRARYGTAYREKVSDERLRAVFEHVRVGLFGKAKKQEPR